MERMYLAIFEDDNEILESQSYRANNLKEAKKRAAQIKRSVVHENHINCRTRVLCVPKQ
jgi:hypothetical protein